MTSEDGFETQQSDVLASDSQIRRRTAVEAIQHPATLLPAGVCVISSLYFVALSPLLGFALGSAAIAIASGAAATASYLYQYRKNYPSVARQINERLELARVRSEEASLRKFCDELESGFNSVGSSEGLRTLAELNTAYEQLELAMIRRRATDPLSVSLVPALAGETYRTALSVLSNALDLMKLQDSSNTDYGGELATAGRDLLTQEIAELERGITAMKRIPEQAERLSLASEMLASRKDRLAMVDQLQLQVERLLFEARRCEASLYATQFDLASIRTGGTRMSVDMVIRAMQSTIRQAKEVQNEFERQNQGTERKEDQGT